MVDETTVDVCRSVDATNSRTESLDCAQQKTATNSRKTRLRCFQCCEVLILTPVMLVIIGLFSIPTIIYALSEAEVVQEPANKINTTCSQVEIYTGSVCRDALTSSQICFSGVTSPPPALNIPSLIDQQTGERDAMRLVNGLTFLSPSPQCGEAIIPFLCLSIFTLCDSSNHLHTILREDCLELRDNICAEEWSQAVGFFGAGVLPVCEDLPDNIDECIGSADNSSLNISHLNKTTSNQTSSGDQLACSDGFFFDENVTNLCRPICGEFRRTKFAVQVLENASICICFVASVIMFILALTVQRESLLLFPLNLLVYLCVTTFILSGVTIVGIFDNAALFCGSRDLVHAVLKGNETTFCIISGFVFIYSMQQVCIWGGLHAGFILWGLRYPFSYRMFKISGRIRYAHIISIVLAVVVPLPGALIHLKDGYVITASPSLICAGRNTDYTYYTFILPLTVMLIITTCLVVLIFWTVLKEFVLKKLLAQKKMGRVGTTQLRITVVLIYYTALGVMGMITSTVSFTSYANITENIAEYLACESSGMSDCESNSSLPISSTLAIMVVVLFSFLPVVSILFTCDPRACKRKPKAKLLKKSSALSELAISVLHAPRVNAKLSAYRLRDNTSQ